MPPNPARPDASLDPASGLMAPPRLKWLSIVLGLWMSAFGFLKLFHPASDWFDSQIRNSGLPRLARPLGIGTEILVGLLLLLPWLVGNASWPTRRRINVTASLLLISQMLVATYVHLQPNVPANVLPLGIKPPIIPLTLLLLAAINGLGFFRAAGCPPAATSRGFISP